MTSLFDPTGTRNNSPTYVSNPRAEMLPFVPSEARSILDVGCADGEFGSLLRRRGGLETLDGIDVEAVEDVGLTSVYDRRIVGSFPDGVHDVLYDCIVFNDVLEHMDDPWSALRSARAHLAPAGILVASIPNVQYFPVSIALVLGGSWNYQSSGVLDRTHLRFFTRQSLYTCFSECGYSVETIVGLHPVRRWALRFAPVLPRTLEGGLYRQFAVVARPHGETEALGGVAP